MGQSSSQPATDSDYRQNRRRSILRRSIRHRDGDDGQHGPLTGDHSTRQNTSHIHSSSTNRLLQVLGASADFVDGTRDRSEWPRRDLLQRTRSTFRDFLSRETSGRRGIRHLADSEPQHPARGLPQHRASLVRAGTSTATGDYYLPRLPSIDLRSSFEDDGFTSREDPEPLAASFSTNQRSNARFNPLRPNRPFRNFTSSLRRRRSLQHTAPSGRTVGAEDQAFLLSQLLSAAAVATAATLVGENTGALGEVRDLGSGMGIGDLRDSGEDGTFDGFLRALSNGWIASALRQGNDANGESPSRDGILNFFRMFRFGSSGVNADTPIRSSRTSEPTEVGDGQDGRMVPIIIVGIRSISPNSNSRALSPADDLPPFIGALDNLASLLPEHALGAHGHDSIDTVLRPPQNRTFFRHRRRASMGGFTMSRNRIDDRLDDQRYYQSPDRRRESQWSIASSTSNLEPRPPPATPASPGPELSRMPSRTTTPTVPHQASYVANGVRDLTDEIQQPQRMHWPTAASPLGVLREETASLHSAHSSDNLLSQRSALDYFRYQPHRPSNATPTVRYPRFVSGHPRRNGVVEPDNLPNLSGTSPFSAAETSGDSETIDGLPSSNNSWSWIIYVLGGSYPENHAILTTPSLFTENPTYEDMMLLSALLGPAKAPAASDEDVQSAGGIYNIEAMAPPQVPAFEPVQTVDEAKTADLVAVATAEHSAERIELESGQRCLVCLCDFEVGEAVRKLVKCNHLFHQECIDLWLTQGRNSCPLCRGQGVNEKEAPFATSTPADPAPEPGSPASPAQLEAGGNFAL